MKSLACRRLLMPALCISMVLGALSSARAQTKTTTAADRLPKDVYVYVSAPSVTEFKKRFMASSSGKMLNDPAFAPIRKDIEAHLKAASAEAEKATGYSLEKLLSVFEGEASLAVVKGNKIPGVLLFVDFGSNKMVVDKLLTIAEQAAKNEGAAVSKEQSNGTTLKLITPPGAAAGEEGDIRTGPKQYAYCIKGTYLVFSTDVPALKKTLANWSGESAESFAKSPVYSYIRKRCQTDGRAPAMEWYVNPMDLIQDVIRSNNDIPQQAKMAINFLPLLGITKFRAFGGSADMATKDFESITKSVIYVEQPPTGLLNFFQFPAVKQAPPKWVSADASSYMAFNWDVATAYKAFETFFNMVGPLAGTPQLDALIKQLADDPNGPGIHIKNDVIDQLTGRIDVATSVGGQGIPRFTVAIGMKDEQKANALLTKLTNDPNFPGKKRMVNGKPLYEVDLGAAFGGNTGPMGFAIADGSLVVASDVAVVEGIVGGKAAANPLVNSPVYKKIAARFPEKTSMISFQRSDAQVKAAWDQIRGGAIPVDIPGIDLSKLPPFEAIKKYLPVSGGYTIPDKNGAYSESFTPRMK